MSRQAQIFPEPDLSSGPGGIQSRKSTRDVPDSVGESSAAEITKIIQGVFLAHTNASAPHAVVFCGANRGAGSTWVCARTAAALAEASAGTVCLIDANLRCPSLHIECGAENSPGFAEMIQSSQPAKDYTRKISPDVWLVGSGGADARSRAALNANSLVPRFLELRAAFDFLLIDTPAVNVWPDALLLGRLADGVVMVVGSDSTRRETARNAKASLEALQIPVLGAVLNKRTFPIPDAIYRKI